MSEEDILLMAIAASLADDQEGTLNESTVGADVSVTPLSSQVQPVNLPVETSRRPDSSVSDNFASPQRNVGIAKLIGTGCDECDNEEDAITGAILNELPESRVVRFDVTHSKRFLSLSRQNSDDSLKSRDSFSGEGLDSLSISERKGKKSRLTLPLPGSVLEMRTSASLAARARLAADHRIGHHSRLQLRSFPSRNSGGGCEGARRAMRHHAAAEIARGGRRR